MSAESPPAPAAPKRSRTRRLLKWAAILAVVVVAAVAALPALLSTSAAREAILAWLADNVDRRVEFSRLEVSWMHGIRLEGLSVSDTDGAREPLLEAPLVEIDAPMLPLLWKKVHAKKFVVRDAVVRLTARAEGGSNATGVVKTKRVRRRSREKDEEHVVLPEIHVPVEVTNLTIVFKGRDGREARQGGIDFAGRLDTREGPTTFDLRVPAGPSASIHMKGEAKLFEPDGTLLSAETRTVDAALVVTNVDAKANRDLLALFLGDSPASGVLDGKVDAHVKGRETKCDVELRLARLGYGKAAASAATRTGDDLTLAGRFELSGDRVRVTGCKIRADGLSVDAELAGGFESMEGRATVDADLARITDALRAAGADFPGSVSGKLVGSMVFSPSPSKGTGDFTLTAFRVEGLVKDRPPVVVESAGISFVVAPGKDRQELTSFEVKLPDLVASAHGARSSDGSIDLTAEAKGDLGGLLARVRDLGFLPQAFALNGSVDAQFRVKGPPSALVVEIPRLALTEKDAKIEASGSRAADGALDFRASGAGDLGALFGRAAAAGAGPKELGELRGRFAFEATAKGPPDALVVELPRLHVEGDLNLDAHGRLAADGRVDAEVTDLSGRWNDVLLLLRRTAIVDRDLTMPGRLTATAVVRGTREKLEVPRATLKCAGGPLELDVDAAISSTGAVEAKVSLSADLAEMSELARRAGFVDRAYPLSGRATCRATIRGTREKIEAPEFRLSMAGDLAGVDVAGSYGAGGVISATINVSGDVDRAVAFARQAGWMKGDAGAGCTYSFRAVAAGTKDSFHLPSARLIVAGPLRVDVDGSMDAEHRFAASGKVAGALQPLLDLAAAWSGEEAKRVEGTIDGSIAAEGKSDAFDVRAPQLSVVARSFRIDADGARHPDGSARGHAKASGSIEDLLAIVRAFGYATDVDATGRLDAEVSGSLSGSKAECALSIVAGDLVVANPKLGGATFREPRFALSVPAAKYDVDTKTGQAPKLRLELDGASVDVAARYHGGVVSLEGSLVADRKLALNHADLLANVSFTSMSGPFQFQGDVSEGRAGAAKWTGGFTLSGEGVAAPYVRSAGGKIVGKLSDGALLLDPVDATLNGGTAKGTASIGLVGDAPSHRLALAAKDVEIDSVFAPLVAHASPLFAVGEQGRTGGKAAAEFDLTAKGLDSKSIRRTVSGAGTFGVADAYVQSTNWIGELLQFVGEGDRLDIGSMTVPFTVRDGAVETKETPLSFAGVSMLLGGHASVTDGKLAYALRVKSPGGGFLAKFASLLDKDGYIPLRLEGTLSKPKLKLPDLKDALRGGLESLLGGRKDEPRGEDKDKGKDEKKKKRKPPEETGPTPPTDTGKPKETPPSEPPKSKEPPPVPGPDGKSDPSPPPPDTPAPEEEPPPPPPPK